MLSFQNKIYIAVCCLLGFHWKASAQQLLPFDKEAKATCLFQDSKEKVWIGSSKGLFAYDGLNFKPFLPQNNVTAIFEDKNKKLWIGYENGEIRYLNNKGETELWNIEEGLPKAKITGFAEDKIGRFWFSTYGEGVYYYQDKHLYNVNQDDGLPSNEVYDIAFADAIWIGTDGGASRIQFLDNQKVIKTLTTEDGLGDNIINKIKFQNQKLIMDCSECPFSYQYGFRFDELKVEKTPKISNNCIDELRTNSGIWTITSKGLFYKDFFREKTKIETLPFKVQVHSQNVYYENRYFGEYFGTANGLFYRENGKVGFKKIQLSDNQNVSISCISADTKYTYVGTFSDGLFILDKFNNRVLKKITQKDGINDNSVLSNYGNIFSTIGGLYEVKIDNKGTFSIENWRKKISFDVKYVYSICKSYESGNATLWLGTDGDGIIKINPDFSSEKISNLNGQEIKTVYQITSNYYYEYLFFATPDMGFIRYDIRKKEFEIFNKNNGIRSNNINSLYGTREDITIAHDLGIDIYDFEKNTCRPILHPYLETFYEPNLNIIDGNTTDITLGNKLLNLNGRIEGPKIHFESIKLFNQNIDYQQDSVFSHQQNFFNFEWCGIYYPKPDALHFQYMLDGFDRDWNDTKERNVTYPRLPAGDYTFRVKALLGTYPSEEIRYHFTVKSAFWETPFFIISLLMLSGLGIFYFIKLREKRLQKTAQLEQEKIIAQYDAIRSQVNPHFLFNTFNALVAVIETDQKQGVLFVEKLSDFFRNMLQHRDKETIAICEESGLLQDYIFILKKRFGESLIIHSNIEKIEGNIVPLTLQILVENAVKHNIVSKSKSLTINILAKENFIIIENNLQPKTQTDNSTKFGLEGIVKRYALLTKTAVLIEKTNEKFVVKIPIL
jgi:hypothetical protein